MIVRVVAIVAIGAVAFAAGGWPAWTWGRLTGRPAPPAVRVVTVLPVVLAVLLVVPTWVAVPVVAAVAVGAWGAGGPAPSVGVRAGDRDAVSWTWSIGVRPWIATLLALAGAASIAVQLLPGPPTGCFGVRFGANVPLLVVAGAISLRAGHQRSPTTVRVDPTGVTVGAVRVPLAACETLVLRRNRIEGRGQRRLDIDVRLLDERSRGELWEAIRAAWTQARAGRPPPALEALVGRAGPGAEP